MSVQTTERYLGCKQRIHNAVNDRIGPEQSKSAVLNSRPLQVHSEPMIMRRVLACRLCRNRSGGTCASSISRSELHGVALGAWSQSPMGRGNISASNA